MTNATYENRFVVPITTNNRDAKRDIELYRKKNPDEISGGNGFYRVTKRAANKLSKYTGGCR